MGKPGTTRRPRRRALAAVTAALAMATTTAPDAGAATAAHTAAQPAAVTAERVVSHYELDTGLFLHRDAGYSVPLAGPLAGNSLWLFGDTGLSTTEAPGGPGFLLPGAWGAVGPSAPGVVPTVSEVPPAGTPITAAPDGRAPNRVVPEPPPGLLWPDGTTACWGEDAEFSSYAAAWPMGATAGPAGPMTLRTDGSSAPISIADGSRLVFVAVPEVCVVVNKMGVPLTLPRGFQSLDDTVWAAWPDMVIQRQKLVAYSPGCITVGGQQVCNQVVASTTLFRTTNGTALPWTRFLLNPVFADGHLYLNAHRCDTWAATLGACTQGRVTSVRAPVGSLHDPAAYRWRQASGAWGAEATAATALPAPANGGAILTDLHDFRSVGEGFLLMQQWHFGGGYNLWQAPSPAGPWTLRHQGTVPGCASGPGNGCYALVGHPELSAPGDLVYSYHDMSDGFVKLSSLDLP